MPKPMSSSTSTSLTLRALLKTAATRLGLGVPGRSVGGLTSAAKAFFAAAAAARQTVFLVAPTDAEAEQLTSDARFFLSALDGLSDLDAAQAVLPFPSHEVDRYRGLSPHFDIASARARALYALSQGQGADRRGLGGCTAASAQSSRAPARYRPDASAKRRHLSGRSRRRLAGGGLHPAGPHR